MEDIFKYTLQVKQVHVYYDHFLNCWITFKFKVRIYWLTKSVNFEAIEMFILLTGG